MSNDSAKGSPKGDPEPAGSDGEDLSNAQAAEQEQELQEENGQESSV